MPGTTSAFTEIARSRTAGDIGMYAQNFLLSLAARGLAGIPQTVLGVYADTVREFLGVPSLSGVER
ncbi:nitroreductase family protein [Streptomyces sp. NPDC060053]|uniref:nitroreductase family protein n=1 Tax=Streptomyces sp. NPDC060053 TaxID=3347047 RepID=UPI0036770A71